MRYLGGKAKIAKKIVEFLNNQRKPNQLYLEPCIGGGSIFRLMDAPKIGADIDFDLILFYKAIQGEWRPPQHISEEDYRDYKQINKDGIHSPKIGFIKYFCSFGGKPWGGFAKESGRDFAKEQYKDSLILARQISNPNINILCVDYETSLRQCENCLVYIDPPYEGTTKFDNKFDHERFWQVIREQSLRHDIFVSSYVAPRDFECAWSCERKTELNTKNGKEIRIEKIFKYGQKI